MFEPDVRHPLPVPPAFALREVLLHATDRARGNGLRFRLGVMLQKSKGSDPFALEGGRDIVEEDIEDALARATVDRRGDPTRRLALYIL